jgi:hypothetical protein
VFFDKLKTDFDASPRPRESLAPEEKPQGGPPPVPLEHFVTGLAKGTSCDALWGSVGEQTRELLTRSFRLRCPVGSFTAWLRALAAMECAAVEDERGRTEMVAGLGKLLASARRDAGLPTELNKLVALLSLMVASRALPAEFPASVWHQGGATPDVDRAAVVGEQLVALFGRANNAAAAGSDLQTAYWATVAVLLFAEDTLAQVKGPQADELRSFADYVRGSMARRPTRGTRTEGPFSLFRPAPGPPASARPLSVGQWMRLALGGNLARITTVGYAVIGCLALAVALASLGACWFHSGRATVEHFHRHTIQPMQQELDPAPPQR